MMNPISLEHPKQDARLSRDARHLLHASCLQGSVAQTSTHLALHSEQIPKEDMIGIKSCYTANTEACTTTKVQDHSTSTRQSNHEQKMTWVTLGLQQEATLEIEALQMSHVRPSSGDLEVCLNRDSLERLRTSNFCVRCERRSTSKARERGRVEVTLRKVQGNREPPGILTVRPNFLAGLGGLPMAPVGPSHDHGGT
ncbi:uncharacterized protein LOC135399166 isoform X2 [Ornithodoros turicata]|uniref:uncharacterized protein LOC135399166 isoform X2 n=1 Tax=Ornithodoros turicata TaxID=34597 RepID=UPI003138AEFA